MHIGIIKTGRTLLPLEQCFGDFEDWFQRPQDGVRYSVVAACDNDQPPPPATYDRIIITGSPAMVTERAPWSEALVPWLKQAATARIPMLGVCYGHQLIAHAFGGSVDWHPHGREIGTVHIERLETAIDDPLLGNLPTRFPAHVSHAQSVITLPPEAIVLARNDFEPHHAYRIGTHIWGLQFHPEFDCDIMRGYLILMAERLATDPTSMRKLLADVKPATAAESVLLRFLDATPL